jgi:hypothetical protein
MHSVRLIPMFRAELFRLTSTRSGRFGLVAPALIGVARIFGGRMVETLENTRRVAQGLKAAAPHDVTAFGPLADGLSAGAPVLAMTALLVGAFSLARERENGGLAQLYLAASRRRRRPPAADASPPTSRTASSR